LPATSQNVTYLLGVRSFLMGSREFLDQSINNDILRRIVIVTGSDGYETVFGAGEIDPEFGGHQIMVAYAKDGQALGPDRYPLIVAPGGRFVSNIIKIEVRVPQP
jgi:hypothetical protein